jgi:GNAT superfamily N-acetyltransferase
MFEGRQDGSVYVDNLASPRTALLCPANGFYFICGEARPDLVAEVLAEVRQRLDAKPILLATSSAWRDLLEPHFPRSAPRLGFVREIQSPPAAPLPAGFKIEPMTAAMAGNWSRPDRTGLDPWTFDIWGGPEGFTLKSFGFAVQREGLPVAFTAACAIGGGEAEVEVGTAPAFRKLGLATATCLAFFEECRRRGLEPAWTTDKTNEASISLAARLGFRPVEEVWATTIAPPIL